jgi:hypothetical protein
MPSSITSSPLPGITLWPSPPSASLRPRLRRAIARQARIPTAKARAKPAATPNPTLSAAISRSPKALPPMSVLVTASGGEEGASGVMMVGSLPEPALLMLEAVLSLEPLGGVTWTMMDVSRQSPGGQAWA